MREILTFLISIILKEKDIFMTGKTHLITAVAVSNIYILTSIHEVSIPNIALFTAGCIYGGLIPDIDADYSLAKKYFPLSALLFELFKKIGHLFHFEKILEHRKLMHSLFFPLICFILPYFLNSNWAIFLLTGLGAGLVSHILLDLFSNGVCLFSPFYNKKFVIGKIKTGGNMESVFKVCLSLLLIVYDINWIILITKGINLWDLLRELIV